MYTFAQRRSRLTTHFSECAPKYVHGQSSCMNWYMKHRSVAVSVDHFQGGSTQDIPRAALKMEAGSSSHSAATNYHQRDVISQKTVCVINSSVPAPDNTRSLWFGDYRWP